MPHPYVTWVDRVELAPEWSCAIGRRWSCLRPGPPRWWVPSMLPGSAILETSTPPWHSFLHGSASGEVDSPWQCGLSGESTTVSKCWKTQLGDAVPGDEYSAGSSVELPCSSTILVSGRPSSAASPAACCAVLDPSMACPRLLPSLASIGGAATVVRRGRPGFPSFLICSSTCKVQRRRRQAAS